MRQKKINFRIDEDVKTQLEEVCEEMDITVTTAFTMFAKRVIRDRKIPFEVTTDPFYSEENINELKRRIANLEAGVSTLKELELIGAD